MKKTITISDVQFIKEGEGKGGHWMLYNVIAEDGEKYSTFNGNKYHELMGQIIEVDYEEQRKQNSKGQTILYKNIVDKPASQGMINSLKKSAGISPVISRQEVDKMMEADHYETSATRFLPANEAEVIKKLDEILAGQKRILQALERIEYNENPLINLDEK